MATKLAAKRIAFAAAPKCKCGRATLIAGSKCWACNYTGPAIITAVE
jgi:hypothetical protein